MVKNHLFHYPRTIKLVNLNKIKFIKIKSPQLSFLFTFKCTGSSIDFEIFRKTKDSLF